MTVGPRNFLGCGLATAMIFLLVLHLRIPKCLDVARDAESWSRRRPALISRHLRGG